MHPHMEHDRGDENKIFQNRLTGRDLTLVLVDLQLQITVNSQITLILQNDETVTGGGGRVF